MAVVTFISHHRDLSDNVIQVAAIISTPALVNLPLKHAMQLPESFSLPIFFTKMTCT
jgi:hypothetical protein